ncbi:hypothetical protein AGABI1DRAFT_119598 [Agaricus bisporus var. burnettii JB137-S8]|uniref:BSD domain-containing protein n=1 Tax=Agaricus bisporus var. burnettii (strain JB137-S8 / ATCC MYA-4627 / FGSC 10392) TaxID=597362 RepID=K5XCQ4_AGABU|nr:uncharacterized protein AGABI1DRAFT_119598 [Agaricus bisporus var. burnettii JB137-S8]EKM81068.1 hypothetical protein AGABI1DRAFT_119598 [Agaricus bisporus var. burnettii JB137-S8]
MNFLDTYDISASSAGSSTPPPNQSQQTLNEEVNQVIGQLGRFWGGFRKQSQTVLETARRDIGDVVTQAQKELTKLANTAAEEPNTERETRRSSSREYEEEATPMSASVSTIQGTSSTDSSTESSGHANVQPQPGSNTQTLFSRLQSALPPNVLSTVQNHIPESIKNASENVDLTQIRMNLLSEVQRIQGVTRAQAEEYAHKSEALLREAVKEAQEVFKDAVKVIPPEGSSASSASATSGLIWDGTDMWTLSGVAETNSDAADADASSGKGKGKSVDSGAAAVATRAEALLRRLKHDPVFVRVDPGVDGTTKDKYTAWIKNEVVSKGGFAGEEWRTVISKSLDDSIDGQALTSLKDVLVPSELAEQEFWQRFFFRVHQIKEEEEKRKALLQANTESEDEFDWDDEDSEHEDENKGEVTKEATPAQDKSMATINNPGLAPPSSTTSTRESSLDSFDVVSSANASVSGDRRTQHVKAAEKDDDEDEDEDEDDSDWE